MESFDLKASPEEQDAVSLVVDPAKSVREGAVGCCLAVGHVLRLSKKGPKSFIMMVRAGRKLSLKARRNHCEQAPYLTRLKKKKAVLFEKNSDAVSNDNGFQMCPEVRMREYVEDIELHLEGQREGSVSRVKHVPTYPSRVSSFPSLRPRLSGALHARPTSDRVRAPPRTLAAISSSVRARLCAITCTLIESFSGGDITFRQIGEARQASFRARSSTRQSCARNPSSP